MLIINDLWQPAPTKNEHNPFAAQHLVSLPLRAAPRPAALLKSSRGISKMLFAYGSFQGRAERRGPYNVAFNNRISETNSFVFELLQIHRSSRVYHFRQQHFRLGINFIANNHSNAYLKRCTFENDNHFKLTEILLELLSKRS